ncbi:MAG: hypothetical protein JST92_20610 [Deltaproteobacteria bacterium]|nr:hypothetical protein [Deltaproteobacteria bacterium]
MTLPFRPLAVCALLALTLSALPARADEEPKWERKEFECKRPEKGCRIPTCCEYGFGVWTREKEGTSVKEVKAVGEVDASPETVFNFVTNYENQKGNLPYVTDQKVFSRTDTEVVFWTTADFPLVSARDWVLKSTFKKNFDGGKYQASWAPIDLKEAPAPKDGIVRLKINEGSWTLEPLDGGKRTKATYYLFTDPGGSIPGFIANKANTQALPDLFEAVRSHCEKKKE